ncbi:MAG TPA: DUF1007 family protein [Stellaceae bacterium]|nr:DUF1007 family protein [Stellaceae bacterium]
MRTGIAAAAALVLSAMPAAAHPHVFIDYAVVLQFDGGALKSVRMTWTFDEMYSSMLSQDYTSHPRGPLGAADVTRLQKGAFEDTADYHYFVDVTLNGKPIEVKKVTDFAAKFEHHRMTYSFTVPIGEAPASGKHALEIAAFDNEFYIDFELVDKDAVGFENAEGLGVSCAPKKARKNTPVIGAVDTVVMACTWGEAS